MFKTPLAALALKAGMNLPPEVVEEVLRHNAFLEKVMGKKSKPKPGKPKPC